MAAPAVPVRGAAHALPVPEYVRVAHERGVQPVHSGDVRGSRARLRPDRRRLALALLRDRLGCACCCCFWFALSVRLLCPLAAIPALCVAVSFASTRETYLGSNMCWVSTAHTWLYMGPALGIISVRRTRSPLTPLLRAPGFRVTRTCALQWCFEQTSATLQLLLALARRYRWSCSCSPRRSTTRRPTRKTTSPTRRSCASLSAPNPLALLPCGSHGFMSPKHAVY